MIIKKNIFGFKTIRYVLEPLPDTEALTREYDMINILSYDNINLKNFEVKRKKTPVIFFNHSLGEIFQNFNKTTRNEIRKTKKISELEFRSGKECFKDALNLYAAHEYSQGRVPERKKEFEGCIPFCAYMGGEAIASVICFDSPEYLRAKAISSQRMEVCDSDIYRIIGYASRCLVWEICKYGKNNGYQGFDLGSVNFKDPRKTGITKFKMAFGGRVIDEYHFCYKNPWFIFFEKFSAPRLFFKRIFWRIKNTVLD